MVLVTVQFSISEITDSLTVVVSEKLGISVAINGL